MSHTDLADANVPLPEVSLEQLSHFPSCKVGLLRPGVVWFGEPLPDLALSRADAWFSEASKVDLMLVIGTTAYFTPAVEYIDQAKDKGAHIAVFNLQQDEEQLQQLRWEDWLFRGDAAVMLPELLEMASWTRNCLVRDQGDFESS